jgi:hypothetical protein
MLDSNLTKIFERINCTARFFFDVMHLPNHPDVKLKSASQTVDFAKLLKQPEIAALYALSGALCRSACSGGINFIVLIAVLVARARWNLLKSPERCISLVKSKCEKMRCGILEVIRTLLCSDPAVRQNGHSETFRPPERKRHE